MIRLLGGDRHECRNAVDPNYPGREFVDFWNEVLAPKFIRLKHVLVDGLTHHSAAIFPSLPAKEGDNVRAALMLSVSPPITTKQRQSARRRLAHGNPLDADQEQIVGRLPDDLR